MMANSKNGATWLRESGYILALLGSAVGFANLLSFSAQCYKNGGGAFLVPFIVANVVIGLPMLVLEGKIGQNYSAPLSAACLAAGGRIAKAFGWLMVIACLTIGSFYTVLTGWTIIYGYFAGAGLIPENTGEFFKHTFLHDSGSLTDFGSFSWAIFAASAAAMAFTWYVLVRGIRNGIELVCSYFLPLLTLMIVGFAASVCFLPGAFNGFYQYLYPDFSQLGSFCLWRDVFGHVFFSYSLGLGIVVGYSRYTKKSTSIAKAMLWVALGDCFISIVSGLAIFGCVGFMSHQSGLEFAEIVKSDSTFEMGFVIFPKILQLFSPTTAAVLGALFFFSVFIAGITGVFSIAESVAGNLEVEFGLSRKRSVTYSVAPMLALAMFFCWGNGMQVLGALAPMVLGNNMLLGGIAEIVIFLLISKKLKADSGWHFKSLRYLALPVLIFILLGSLWREFHGIFGAAEVIRYGWLTLAVTGSIVLSGRMGQL